MLKNRCFSWLYNICLFAIILAYLPKIIKKWAVYKNILPNKWGKGFPTLKGKAEQSAPIIWIHAVSLGETKAIVPLVKMLKEQYSHAIFLITSITDTGHMEAKKSLPFANYFLYLPFDFSWIIKPVVKNIKPDMVLLSEGDYWHHFLQAAKENGAFIATVNGKLSEKSQHRYSYLTHLGMKNFFSPIDLFCLQSLHYSKRFKELKIEEKKLVITGNLKLDFPVQKLSQEEVAQGKKIFHFQPDDFVLVAGSTHPLEEELLLSAFLKLSKEYPQFKLVLVPRHPERFETVKALVQSYDLPFLQFSKIKEAAHTNAKILLIDAMGQLNFLYQLATCAIVCGSFNKNVGGHNILEPSVFGTPILFGPHMYKQKDFLDLALDSKSGIQVNENNLVSTLKMLIETPSLREELGKNGLQLSLSQQGASRKTLEEILKKFSFQKIDLAKK